MVIQLKFDILCMLSGPEKKVRRIVFLFSFFQQNLIWPTNHMLLWRAWTASPICFKEATYPGHMLIRFWCDSEITFSRGLHKNLVTVLYFSIINVLCGAGGDASFAPQANLVISWYWLTEPTAEGSCQQLIAIFDQWSVVLKWNEWGFRSLLCTYRLNWARRTSWGLWDELNDPALHTHDSTFEPFGLRPSMLPLGHGGFQYYWIITSEPGINSLFFWNLRPGWGSNPRSHTFQAGSFNHCTSATALLWYWPSYK